MVVASSAKNRTPRVRIHVFVGPLPDVPHHVECPEWARALRMGCDIVRAPRLAALVGNGHRLGIPRVAPGVRASIASLRRVLPFPFVGQTFSRPLRIRSCILQRNPGDWLIGPSLRVGSSLPIPEEVNVILGVVMGRVEKLLEILVRHRVLIEIKRTHRNALFVEASRRIFPRILNIDSGIIGAFNLHAFYPEDVISSSHCNHARGSSRRKFCGRHIDHLLRKHLPLRGVA